MTCRIFVRVGCTPDAGSPTASDPHVAARQHTGSARALRGSSRSRHCPESPAFEATHRLVRCTSALRGNQPPARSAVSTAKPIDLLATGSIESVTATIVVVDVRPRWHR